MEKTQNTKVLEGLVLTRTENTRSRRAKNCEREEDRIDAIAEKGKGVITDNEY